MTNRHPRANSPRGFTLIELLVVLFIVGLLSAATLPILIPTLSQRQVQDGARVLQQALINARFAAMSTGRPAGVRLLPDPAFSGPDTTDPFRPLVYNRLLLLEEAADYSDGQLRVHSPGAGEQDILNFFVSCIAQNLNWRQLLIGTPPNAAVSKGRQDPFQNMILSAGPNSIYRDPRIVLRQYKSETKTGMPTPVEPTSWSWNVRAGDRIVVGVQNISHYVIAGPVAPLTPGGGYNPATFNPERFVNLGTPSFMLPFQLPTTFQQPNNLPPLTYPHYDSEILYVVNEGNRMFDGVDNNGDGVIDPAFDGLDNDGNGYIDDPCEIFYHSMLDPQIGVVAPLLASGSSPATILQALRTSFEWEPAVLSSGKPDTDGFSIPQEYTIKRRMVPAASASEIGLPADVVIDATTGLSYVPNFGIALNPPNVNYAQFPTGDAREGFMTTAERSRLPIDPLTRYVDIIFQPDGQVVSSSASSVNGPPFQVPFYHLWLTDRGDVFPPTNPVGKSSRDQYVPRLPLAESAALGLSHEYNTNTEWALKNERRLITIQTRTGRISSQTIELFDSADPNLPFQDAQKGIAEAGQ